MLGYLVQVRLQNSTELSCKYITGSAVEPSPGWREAARRPGASQMTETLCGRVQPPAEGASIHYPQFMTQCLRGKWLLRFWIHHTRTFASLSQPRPSDRQHVRLCFRVLTGQKETSTQEPFPQRATPFTYCCFSVMHSQREISNIKHTQVNLCFSFVFAQMLTFTKGTEVWHEWRERGMGGGFERIRGLWELVDGFNFQMRTLNSQDA